jgi:uncharacterized delta-60 repeat protein
VWTLEQATQYIKAGTWPSQPGPFWIGLLRSSTSDLGNAVAVDSSGNVYVCGFSSVTGTTDIILVKYNSSGIIQWQKSLGGGNTNQGNSVTVDSSGNIYVCGVSNTATGTYQFQIAKYDTSGTIQWQRRLGDGSVKYGWSVAVDSSGNVYVGGYGDATGTEAMFIAKYNTSGAIQWQRIIADSTYSDIGWAVATDSSGNVYFCGFSDAATGVPGVYNLVIAKYNTSGTIQWQRSLGSIDGQNGRSVAVDSSGNVYVCGASGNNILIAKYNTSGTIQWQRIIGSGSGAYGNSVAVDSSGNVYGLGTNGANLQIAKYNTSGTIQWQRSLSSSGFNVGYSIASDVSGNIYVCGYSTVSGNNDFLFAKLPADGSLTNTYSVGGYSFTYAASSLTAATSTLTDAVSSLTSAVSSLTAATSTLTSATSTLTSSVTTL